MAQHSTSPQTSFRDMSSMSQGQRVNTPACVPRGSRGPPTRPGAPLVPPPPIRHYNSGFRAARSHGNNQSNVSGTPPPPPPPYPPLHPPQPYCLSMMPQGPAAFNHQWGTAAVGRTPVWNYGVSHASGVPMLGPPERWYSGHPPTVPYAGGQIVPPIPEALKLPPTPCRPVAIPRGPKNLVRDSAPSRSKAGAGAINTKHQRPAPPAAYSLEPVRAAGAPAPVGLRVRPGEPDCKHFLSRGWCSYGSGCKYNHPQVVPVQPPAPPPLQPVFQGQGAGGMPPPQWGGVGMQYPRFGWPIAQMVGGGHPVMYAPSWGCQQTSNVMYCPQTPPPLCRVDKRCAQPNCSARSSDSGASSSSRLPDPDNPPDRKAMVSRKYRH